MRDWLRRVLVSVARGGGGSEGAAARAAATKIRARPAVGALQQPDIRN